MNTRVLGTCVGLLLLCGSAAAAAEPELNYYFLAPKEWKMLPPSDNNLLSYQTSVEKKDSLLVLVRPVRAGGQSPQQWAADEAAQVKQQGFDLVEPPAEYKPGETAFVRMVSLNDLAGFPLRQEQHFCTYSVQNELLEVVVMGPEDFFGPERGRIEEFLKSFRFRA